MPEAQPEYTELRRSVEGLGSKVDDMAVRMTINEERVRVVQQNHEELKPLIGMIAEIKVKLEQLVDERRRQPNLWQILQPVLGWLVGLLMAYLGLIAVKH